MVRSRFYWAALFSSLSFSLLSAPVSALERLVLRMPFLETSITINLGEVESAAQLIRSSPDLEDLQSASGGKLLSLLETIFLAPLPVETRLVLEGSSGQPLLEQALLAAASLVKLEGVDLPPDGSTLTDALIRAERKGQANVLGFLREMPGQEASVDLSQLATMANRLMTNMQEGAALAKAGPAVSTSSALQGKLRQGWIRSQLMLPVSHRPEPLRVLLLTPKGPANGRLVVISHGLWDDPESFEGWGEFLATEGYTVLMPDHPGSDFTQQKAMLAGDRPPPGPEELRLRPRDVSALLDAVESGKLLSGQSLNTQSVAVVGHSWGATTSLQLAGGTPIEGKLASRCSDLSDPERNISWVLQCSWLSGIEQAAVSDSRVKAVVAVSPPLRLLFDPDSSSRLSAKVLLVSGTRDWVVPSGPEAIAPMRTSGAVRKGHRLVLVKGADHFSLRSFRDEQQPAIAAPMILAWVNEQLGVESSGPYGSLRFSSGGWGNQTLPLIDISYAL
jgi:predicted dienelactone hydrolase